MTLLARAAPNGLLLASAFVLQGLLLARQEPGGAVFVLPLFVLFAVWSVMAKSTSALGGFLVGSAALGGLGMAIGRFFDPTRVAAAHALHSDGAATLTSLAPIASWSGVLMLAGCTAACLLPPSAGGRARGRTPALLHHVWSLLGMLAGMQAAHWLTGLVGLELSGWGMHLAMVAAMLFGGWGALALAARVARTGPKVD